MNATLPLFRIKNRVMGAVAPKRVGQRTALAFLTPRHYPLKDWEQRVERSCRRLTFGNGLSAAAWGEGQRKVLLMHGWESRATQLFTFVPPLVERGFKVIAIDGPEHGHSNSGKANAVAFAEAIREAERTFGPFFGAIGHSMGAAAIALAMEAGARFERVVLIASPANFHQVMLGYASFIGLPKQCTDSFIYHVEKEVGRPGRSLDVGRIFAALKPDALLVHARDDQEVPFKSVIAISRAYPGLKIHIPEDLGHRKIIRSPEVAKVVADYIASDTVTMAADNSKSASMGGRRA